MCWKSDGQSTTVGKKKEEERDHTMVHGGFSQVPRFSETLSDSTNYMLYSDYDKLNGFQFFVTKGAWLREVK